MTAVSRKATATSSALHSSTWLQMLTCPCRKNRTWNGSLPCKRMYPGTLSPMTLRNVDLMIASSIMIFVRHSIFATSFLHGLIDYLWRLTVGQVASSHRLIVDVHHTFTVYLCRSAAAASSSRNSPRRRHLWTTLNNSHDDMYSSEDIHFTWHPLLYFFVKVVDL